MKNGLYKVLFDVFIILSILFTLDVFIGWAGEKYIHWLNRKPRNSDAALVNYSLNAAAPDVAIIGSSTAICHYVPTVLHDSLCNMGYDYKVFNMGIANQRLTYDYYGLRCLLKRTIPKIVIVDVWASFLGEGNPTTAFEAFKPYIKVNEDIKEMLKTHDQLNILSKSNLYCFNTQFVKLLLAVFRPSGSDGFHTSNVELEVVKKGVSKDKSRLSSLSVTEFNDMLSLAKSKNIKLFVIMSPTLRSSDTTSMSYHYIKNKCKNDKIPFLDYSNDEKYQKSCFFQDTTHLNYSGAYFFSSCLMRDLKKYLSKE